MWTGIINCSEEESRGATERYTKSSERTLLKHAWRPFWQWVEIFVDFSKHSLVGAGCVGEAKIGSRGPQNRINLGSNAGLPT